jgi:hypothetical protein
MLTGFGRFQEEVIPAQKVAHHQLPEGEDRWKTVIPIIEELKVKAKRLGLWNLFLSKTHYPKYGVPLTNLEVRILVERVGLVVELTMVGCFSMLLWLKSLDEEAIWLHRW